MTLVALRDTHEETRFGGKAIQLGAAIRAGLPVPDGFAIAHDAGVEELLADREQLARALSSLGGVIAVRSSAIGEDSATASFAGQHATVLGVRTVDGVANAIAEVLASAHTDAALAYRKKLGVDAHPKMGIVLQHLTHADVAGVLFSRHPTTGADERVIEASWGLGEIVVQGLVTPDRFRLARGGRILERSVGDKDLAIVWSPDGGTEEVPIDEARAQTLCLDDAMLASLDALTTRCEQVFGGTQDLEFAFEHGDLFLLQRRAITRG